MLSIKLKRGIHSANIMYSVGVPILTSFYKRLELIPPEQAKRFTMVL